MACFAQVKADSATDIMVGSYDEDLFLCLSVCLIVCRSICTLCTVCRRYLDEGTHHHCEELGIHKNDREAELLNELYDVRICGLVRSSE